MRVDIDILNDIIRSVFAYLLLRIQIVVGKQRKGIKGKRYLSYAYRM